VVADETPFHLRGNFAPVRDEVGAQDLRVEGALPPELCGLYVRNGPNSATGTSPHWFFGHGMLHGVRLERGRALWYRNRYVRTPYLENPGARRLGPDGRLDRTVASANTHVIAHAGRILALDEGSFPYEVDGELRTIGCRDFGARLRTALTAHPKHCPVTGELFAYGCSPLPPYLTFHRFSAAGELVRSEEIPVAGPTLMHDFAITETHALFLELPVVFDLSLAGRGMLPYRWSDAAPARVGVMPRSGDVGALRWFPIEPCYVPHVFNAYDEGDSVVLDGCRLEELLRDPAQLMGRGQTLHRWTFDLAGGSVKEETLDRRAVDFPRVADARIGRKHRFGFSVEMTPSRDGAPSFDGLVKYDLARGRCESHRFGEGHPGEAVFVPAEGADPNGDDGTVLCFVHDEGSGRSEFVVLDASRFESSPIARVPLPQRVPYGLHGSWIPDAV
jgi:carotenoid cleavage dioxygenase